MPATSIPIIDFTGAFSSGLDARRRVAQALHGAATTFGFFYAANHGVAAGLIERQLE